MGAAAGDERFPILGRPLLARLRTPGLLAWLRRQWSFPEHAPVPLVSYAIHIEEVDAPPELPVGAPVPVPLHRVTLTAQADGEGVWYFGGAHAGVRLRLGESESDIAVWGATHGHAATGISAALFVCVAESLRASGLLPLHAAVAVSGGRAIALAGASGAGKSTTLWRLMQAGWAPLAEDFAWLDPATCLVYGWDRGLRLWPETRARFAPGIPAGHFRPDADGKLFLAYERLPYPVVRSATLERLAVLEREPDAGASGRAPGLLAPHEAVRAWWETIGLPLSQEVRARVAAAIVALARSVDVVRFPLGPGPLPMSRDPGHAGIRRT